VEKVEREQPWLFAVALPKAKVTRVNSSNKGFFKVPETGLPNGLVLAYNKRGVILTTYKSWDDPPSGGLLFWDVQLGLG